MAGSEPKLRDLFSQAAECRTAEEEAAYLDEACQGNAELRAQLDELLQAHREAGSFLQEPSASQVATVDDSIRERPGTVIGPYKLLQQIGEGGMGTVFMAEQTHPVQRKVALKVIKAGMDSKQVIARFEAERQALAVMDHVNIARVFDAGTTEHGRPYFVMELVHGMAITKYCDEHRLTPRERLELFVPVCQAIQHAHQKGIIHRDIKPSNVMVTLYDGKPVPKVIDFGVAKATEQKLTERTLFTQYGQMVGTPSYMSPEQAEMSALGVDTRSDIYSLGVLLYELLTGSTPLSRKRLKEAAYDEVLRMIREEEPPKPSTRLGDSGEALASISANRQMEPAKLTKLLRGELDWIVMKCLEKDRNRRYETASAFAMDVQRYLADEPVVACPPSAAYRLRKFVRRNRGPVLAAALIFLLLVGGIVGTTVGLVQAERAKDATEKRLAQVERGIDLLGSLFEDLDPMAEVKEGRPLRAILGDRLDGAAAELDGEGVGDPLVVARLQDRLGRTYLGLGHAAKAEALFAKARATRQAYLGAADPLTLASTFALARAYHAAGRRNEAIALFEQVRDGQEKLLGARHPDTLTTLTDLASAYRDAGKTSEAIALLEQVRDEQVRQLGEDHDHTLATLYRLSLAYRAVSRNSESIVLAETVHEARVRKHGPDHVLALAALHTLAASYQAAGKMRRATALYEQARDVAATKLGPDHPLTLMILHSLAWNLRVLGEVSEAIALGEKVREARVRTLGARHPSTLTTLHSLAIAYRTDGKPEKALPLYQQAAAGVEELRFMHIDADLFMENICRYLEELQQYDQAEIWRRKWLAAVKEKDGPVSAPYGVELLGLGANLVRQNKHADAELVLRECLNVLQKTQAGPLTTSHSRSLLGAALLGQRKYAEAEPLLVQGYEGMVKASAPRHHSVSKEEPLTKVLGLPRHVREHRGLAASTDETVTHALERLVQLYEDWGKDEQAARWRKELESRTKK